MSARTLLITQSSPVQSQNVSRERLITPEGRYSEISNISTETVNRHPYRKSSSSFVGSIGSKVRQPLRVRNENLPTRRPPSPLTPNAGEGYKKSPAFGDALQRQFYGSGQQTRLSIPPDFDTLSSSEALSNVDLNTCCGEGPGLEVAVEGNACEWNLNTGLSFDFKREEALLVYKGIDGDPKKFGNQPSTMVMEEADHPIRRWMSTFHRKQSVRKRPLSIRKERWVLDEFEEDIPSNNSPMCQTSRSERRKTVSSISSSGFVTAIQSARATLSGAPTPRKNRRSAILRNSNRSSKLSQATNRASIDSNLGLTPIIDEAAWNRAVQRRRALEELISSEESYIADLKVLVNVYFTLLASQNLSQHVSQRTSAQIHLNVKEILSLHEELLVQIKEAIPHSETKSAEPSRKHDKHARWHSVDAPRRSYGTEALQVARRSLEVTGLRQAQRDSLISEPWEVAEVARIFDHMMGRFFIYEEYGAKYESMAKAMASTSKAIPTWQAYERGIEALANSLASTDNGEDNQRKGLTSGDLLIKPIQRVCKYPLILTDLYKNTPVFDCPDSHAEVEKVLSRLHETTREINKATNDRQTQAKIKRSWKLQDLLVFPDTSAAPISLRQLGHPRLCGVLYVAYQGHDRVSGTYMLCALYRSCLLLATPKPGGSQYDIVATIYLNSLRMESSESGRGLLCYNALFSWKIVFESDQQFFELIMCACSLREEEQWKTSITEYCNSYDQSTSPALYSILTLNIRPIGSIFDVTASLTRKFPTRAATVNPRTSVVQVIIKNTYALKETGDIHPSQAASISRSQSLFSTSRTPILAPRRADRLRMEYGLSEVWTREFLPYPGMGASRGEQLIRASANSMMRKLSKASIATSFTKRSASYTSLTDQIPEPERTKVEPIAGMDGPYDTALPPMPAVNASYASRSRYRAVQHVVPPLRISSLRSMKRSKNVKVGKGYPQLGRNISATDRIDHSTTGDAMENAPTHTNQGRRSRPEGLLKSISTYGIRGWFG